MFRQRTSSQKPADDLLANFRQQFTEITATSPTAAGSVNGNVNGNGNGNSNVNNNGTIPEATTTAANSIVPPTLPGQDNHNVFSDQDPTPRASSNEPWRFTPSLLDPGSFSFSSFSHNPGGYYAPTPGGNNVVYRSQAGDLHTPTLGMSLGLNTPLSMPTSDGVMHPGAATTTMMDVSSAGFHSGLHPQAFHTFHPFAHQTPPQASFAPSTFVHHDGTFIPMHQDASALQAGHPGTVAGAAGFGTTHPGLVGYPPGQPHHPHAGHYNGSGAVANIAMLSLPPSAEKFRFHTTLNAPTAMIKHADEIPISYLNKGQAYSLSIIDTEPELPIVPGTRFRTYVRISFEDEQQRQKPGVCWSLWKEGRGTNEAHQRGGKLQAVEYVGAGQPPEGDEKRTRVELENASFDGFSVIWTPGIHGAVECNIAVRFNFLSTDFSHSKGVKGIPVRLCAKTTRYPVPHAQPSSNSPKDGSAPPASEICFCKVKLFRDHGAERKLSNDVAHVKKTIDKLKQQIAQAESGMKDFNKRKRSGNAAGLHAKPTPDLQRMGKVPKHKRTWSVSSASSNGGGGGSGPEDANGGGGGGNSSGSGTPSRSTTSNGMRLAVEEDLHCKLQTLQDMFTSTRLVSILYLRGDELDDPDLHPVSLPGEPNGGNLAKVESRDNLMAWRDRSGRSSVANSSMVSPSPSSLSLHSQVSINGANGINGLNSGGLNAINGVNGLNGVNGSASGHWSDYHDDHLNPHHALYMKQGSDQPTRLSKTDDAGNLTGWIEALDVDPSYRPPSILDRPKPVACFYVVRRNNGDAALNDSGNINVNVSVNSHGNGNGNGHSASPDDGTNTQQDYHRAVYLMKRTLPELVGRLAVKWNLDPTKVVRTVRVLPQGLEVELDDDAVAELPEGQDMVLDVVDAPLTALQDQSAHAQAVKKEWEMALDGDGDDGGSGRAYELRLSF
ncbi:cp2 transcription factor [Niveomyces insectorum RCEF 264]|uniref:Cp2 transcription factor n=1 Tax=Niveomyces insectorum RCEF 264 TaxID=1081102 RepID=A0A167SR00_9HYPO|nr:cp2 transcription factor [Niveomyces insectorum RCEF 264]